MAAPSSVFTDFWASLVPATSTTRSVTSTAALTISGSPLSAASPFLSFEIPSELSINAPSTTSTANTPAPVANSQSYLPSATVPIATSTSSTTGPTSSSNSPSSSSTTSIASSAPSNQTFTQEDPSVQGGNDGLSPGVMAGTIIGSAAGGCLILLVAALIYMRKRDKSRHNSDARNNSGEKGSRHNTNIDDTLTGSSYSQNDTERRHSSAVEVTSQLSASVQSPYTYSTSSPSPKYDQNAQSLTDSSDLSTAVNRTAGLGILPSVQASRSHSDSSKYPEYLGQQCYRIANPDQHSDNVNTSSSLPNIVVDAANSTPANPHSIYAFSSSTAYNLNRPLPASPAVSTIPSPGPVESPSSPLTAHMNTPQHTASPHPFSTLQNPPLTPTPGQKYIAYTPSVYGQGALPHTPNSGFQIPTLPTEYSIAEMPGASSPRNTAQAETIATPTSVRLVPGDDEEAGTAERHDEQGIRGEARDAVATPTKTERKGESEVGASPPHSPLSPTGGAPWTYLSAENAMAGGWGA